MQNLQNWPRSLQCFENQWKRIPYKDIYKYRRKNNKQARINNNNKRKKKVEKSSNNNNKQYVINI